LFSSGFIAAKSMQFNGSESGHARHVFIASITPTFRFSCGAFDSFCRVWPVVNGKNQVAV